MPAEKKIAASSRERSSPSKAGVATPGDTSAKTFDEAMAELESTVARLESGELPLEEALAAFEAGIGLVRLLNQRLTEAESRIEVLTRDAEGSLRLQPLQPDPEPT